MVDPLVLLGYQLDHLLCDSQDERAAADLVRDGLRVLLPWCRQMAERFD